MDNVKALKEKLDQVEQQKRYAVRRVNWIRKNLYHSTTEQEFKQNNAALEAALSEVKTLSVEALTARRNWAVADMQAQISVPAT